MSSESNKSVQFSGKFCFWFPNSCFCSKLKKSFAFDPKVLCCLLASVVLAPQKIVLEIICVCLYLEVVCSKSESIVLVPEKLYVRLPKMLCSIFMFVSYLEIRKFCVRNPKVLCCLSGNCVPEIPEVLC